MRIKHITVGIFVFLILVHNHTFALEQTDTDAEIARLHKEMKQVQAERQRNSDDMAKDKIEATTYDTRTQKRFADINKEIETLKKDIVVTSVKRDSIAALFIIDQNQRTQVTLNEDRLRTTIINTCVKCLGAAQSLPPLASQQIVASVNLLKAEAEDKSIDIIEAMNRLAQIFGRIDEATGSMQVSQENSPVAEIRGTVYRFRIGGLWEAVVDMKGEKAALWKGIDSAGNARWLLLDKPAEAEMLLKSASIREGKALPAFARLPFPFADTTKRGAQ